MGAFELLKDGVRIRELAASLALDLPIGAVQLDDCVLRVSLKSVTVQAFAQTLDPLVSIELSTQYHLVLSQT